MEGIRRSIIEQERQKLLKEHASKLLGYLPKVSYIFYNQGIILSIIITLISTGCV